MKVRHFLRDDDLAPEEQALVLQAADQLASKPSAADGALHGRAIGLMFEKPSLRTRVSSEVACVHLGATPLALRTSELQLARGETPADTARVLEGFLSLVLGRVHDHRFLEELAEPNVLPIVNGLSDAFHPLQTLADLLTLSQEYGEIAGRTIAYVGDGNNLASSLLLACPLAGVNIAIATPERYRPDPAVLARASELAELNGSAVSISEEPALVVRSADAVYTDVWTSMGQEGNQAERRAALGSYQLNADLLSIAPQHAIVLHCLPAHRGEEITAEVFDSGRSRIFRQAHNRLPATAALFLYLLEPEIVSQLADAPWEEDVP